MEERRNKNIGDWGEEQACLFLKRHSFRVVERNYHAVSGEIDIIAILGDDYYFIEVKTRSAGELAYDLAITKAKKEKLQRTVKHYCYHRRVVDVSLILAGLMVVVDRLSKSIHFRLAVLY